MSVRDDGKLSARIVLVGEAPGKREMAEGKPFVGPSGWRLATWWRRVGLSRDMFYITNVLDYLPEHGIDKVSTDEMQEAIRQLHERLAALKDPWLIVPTGNYALYALTGKGKVHWHRKDGKYERPGVLDWRGSILSAEIDSRGYEGKRTVKVIPTLHPAFVLRSPEMERKALKDWQRIAEESQTREIATPERTLHIKPTLDDVWRFAAQAVASGKPVALDIETPRARRVEYLTDKGWESGLKKAEQGRVLRYKSGKKKGQLKMRKRIGTAYIGCIGFSMDPSYAICIPLTLDYWKTKDALQKAKDLVQSVLSMNPLIMQNGMFDAAWLRKEGYWLGNWRWDTRAMHHALDPRDDHDLAYMASVYTRQPFWKHEAKDPEEIEKYASNSEALWSYNCIDAAVTLELYYVLKAKLEAEGLDEFYQRHYADLMAPLLDMTLHGIRADQVRMASERGRLDLVAKDLAAQIEAACGMPLIANKGLSNDRVKFLMYGEKGFPDTPAGAKKWIGLRLQFPDVQPFNFKPMKKRQAKGESSVTVDEVTVRKLILRYPDQLSQLGPLLLDHRRNRKMAEFVDTKILDRDGRFRCMYSFCTEAGRLASAATPWKAGRNLQNIDRELRYVFLPDLEKK